jgi:AraC-like DNA-binding protein
VSPTPASAQWRYLSGAEPLLAGSSLISHCGPHFHDTYTIACMRRGRAEVRAGGRSRIWDDGAVFLGNPYEIHAGGDTENTLVYDVCYPGRALMFDMLGVRSAAAGALPHFAEIVIPVQERTGALAVIIADFLTADARTSAAPLEQALIDFFRANHDLFRLAFVEADVSLWVSSACRLLERAVEDGLDPAPLIDRIGCSRSYLIRQFRKITGITPGAYLRQLQLARARRLLCDGWPIAEVAASMGFADQSHLTREFKRVYGTTPGKLVRDVAPGPDGTGRPQAAMASTVT